tara:strand:+ start:671 stop:805 length:135 start_codon:yes stop_codon:yes gene_type:complete
MNIDITIGTETTFLYNVLFHASDEIVNVFRWDAIIVVSFKFMDF